MPSILWYPGCGSSKEICGWTFSRPESSTFGFQLGPSTYESHPWAPASGDEAQSGNAGKGSQSSLGCTTNYPGGIRRVPGCLTSSNNEAHTKVRFEMDRPLYTGSPDIAVCWWVGSSCDAAHSPGVASISTRSCGGRANGGTAGCAPTPSGSWWRGTVSGFICCRKLDVPETVIVPHMVAGKWFLDMGTCDVCGWTTSSGRISSTISR